MKQRKLKNVNVKSLINTIIVSLIAFLTILIPSFFGGGRLQLTYETMPIIGNGEICLQYKQSLVLILGMIGLYEGIIFDISIIAIEIVSEYMLLGFYSILVLNLLFSIILIITRATFFRVLFKIFSIIFGIYHLLLAIVLLYHSAIIGIMFFTGSLTIDTIIQTLSFVYSVIVAIFAIVLAIKQFKWFAKLY